MLLTKSVAKQGRARPKELHCLTIRNSVISVHTRFSLFPSLAISWKEADLNADRFRSLYLKRWRSFFESDQYWDDIMASNSRTFLLKVFLKIRNFCEKPSDCSKVRYDHSIVLSVLFVQTASCQYGVESV